VGVYVGAGDRDHDPSLTTLARQRIASKPLNYLFTLHWSDVIYGLVA